MSQGFQLGIWTPQLQHHKVGGFPWSEGTSTGLQAARDHVDFINDVHRFNLLPCALQYQMAVMIFE